MNVKGKEERIIEIKNQLENITYDPEKYISLFISELNMLFDELKDLDHRLTKEKKFNYLYTAIPMEISMEIGLMSFKGKWEDASEYLKIMLPELKKLKELKELKELKAKRPVNKSKEIKNSVTLSTEIKRKRNNRQIKCYICNKREHKAKDCWHNPKNKNKKGNKREQANSLEEKGKQTKNCDNEYKQHPFNAFLKLKSNISQNNNINGEQIKDIYTNNNNDNDNNKNNNIIDQNDKNNLKESKQNLKSLNENNINYKSSDVNNNEGKYLNSIENYKVYQQMYYNNNIT
ncbi:hypothetical protein LY90DRAFT_504958 [Neocallimastix californiae]|uniref:CCHC-type domain-containing protein n=1 Tax=Neocallimastix californiae TaxID=1754190 RepID=A0A1Y2E244_9FUNG|nr:hypothetical protein LY90DRAFT_504958 [Neocallimastix californiae]|eukprot:ORY65610.1 hypothetical protein LY90DRAFT_504958 [Neocallimastix californiae]